MNPDFLDCECWIVPFKPECYDYCTGRILRFAKSDDLQRYFNLTPRFADKIFEISSDQKLQTFTDFKKYFSKGEQAAIESSFAQIGEAALKWIKKLDMEDIFVSI